MSQRTLTDLEEEPRERQPAYRTLIVLAAVVFLLLPFVTTFNEFLTAVVMRLGLDVFLREWVVPAETRMMAVLIRPLGIGTVVTADMIHLVSQERTVSIFISWNCVGWQSLVLLVLTLVAGLQGSYTWPSKLQSIFIGVLGTFLVNIFRLASVALVGYFFGRLPAIIYHDYGGTIIILLWLFAFWSLAYDVLLEPKRQEVADQPSPLMML